MAHDQRSRHRSDCDLTRSTGHLSKVLCSMFIATCIASTPHQPLSRHTIKGCLHGQALGSVLLQWHDVMHVDVLVKTFWRWRSGRTSMLLLSLSLNSLLLSCTLLKTKVSIESASGHQSTWIFKLPQTKTSVCDSSHRRQNRVLCED